MCVILIVLYYFDMWLSISSPYHIAQHIYECTFVLVCLDNSQYNVVFMSVLEAI